MKKFYFMLIVARVFAGYTASINSTTTKNPSSPNTSVQASDIIVQEVDRGSVRNIIREEKMLAPDVSESEFSLSTVGEGIAPLNTVSSAQTLVLAERAAVTGAYGQLASRPYDVKVNGRDTVKDTMPRGSTITVQVNGLIKNTSMIDEDFNQDLYRVNVEPKIDAGK